MHGAHVMSELADINITDIKFALPSGQSYASQLIILQPNLCDVVMSTSWKIVRQLAKCGSERVHLM